MKNIWKMGCGVLAVSLSVFMVWRLLYLSELWRQYQKQTIADISSITYRSKTLPMFGDGVLLYHVRFSDIPIEHRIDKMFLRIEQDYVWVQIFGLNFSVNEALAIQGDNLIQSFQSYLPYHSVWTKPLETLSLVGVDAVKANAALKIEQDEGRIHVVGYIEDKRLGRAIVDFYMISDGKISPKSLLNSTVLQGVFNYEDVSLLPAYRSYARSLGVSEPDNWMRDIIVK